VEWVGSADGWGHYGLNVFKNRLVMIRNTRMGFFLDQSANPEAFLGEFPTGEATRDELQGE